MVGRPTRHLICFKQWNAQMVQETIRSACNLKGIIGGCSHTTQLDTLSGCKVTIINEVDYPVLNASVSKAASLLGADSTIVNGHLDWGEDYYGRIFSLMSDALFVSTRTHYCLQRYAEHSLVPVLGMRSRTHAPLRALATLMTVMEMFGPGPGRVFSYVGPHDPLLGSFLVLCPMLGYDIKYKCSCKASPVSPLLRQYAEAVVKTTHNISLPCDDTRTALQDADVIIAGPMSPDKDKMAEYKMTLEGLNNSCNPCWIFMHTCPYGSDFDETIVNCNKTKTFDVFQNMIFIAASLMAYAIKKHNFE